MDKRLRTGIFLALFCALSLVFYNVNLTYLVGAQEQSFSMFQFIGPAAAGIVGLPAGLAAVLAVDVIQKLVLNDFSVSAFNILRFLPMLAAACYFGVVKKDKRLGYILPIAGMIAFWMHPVGAEAWGYALLWCIPIVATVFAHKHVFLRSLGATFQAHIVGSVAFLYTISMPAAAWWGLIPVVLVERGLFAAGISVTYVALHSVAELAGSKLGLGAGLLNTEDRYIVHPHDGREGAE